MTDSDVTVKESNTGASIITYTILGVLIPIIV